MWVCASGAVQLTGHLLQVLPRSVYRLKPKTKIWRISHSRDHVSRLYCNIILWEATSNKSKETKLLYKKQAKASKKNQSEVPKIAASHKRLSLATGLTKQAQHKYENGCGLQFVYCCCGWECWCFGQWTGKNTTDG